MVDGVLIQLYLSRQSSTGYRGVVDCSRPGQQERDRPYKAQATAPQVRPLGYFATKLEAAICYAKWAREERRAVPEKLTGYPRERTHHPRLGLVRVRVRVKP